MQTAYSQKDVSLLSSEFLVGRGAKSCPPHPGPGARPASQAPPTQVPADPCSFGDLANEVSSSVVRQDAFCLKSDPPFLTILKSEEDDAVY